MTARATYQSHAANVETTIEDPQVLTSFFQPFSAEAMQAYQVSTIVNSVKNDTAECIVAAT